MGIMKNRKLTIITFVCLFVISCIGLEAKAGISNQEKAAKKILDATGVPGGFIVHIGCGDGKLTAALRTKDRYLVHGLDIKAESIKKARAYIKSQGLYGKVSVRRFDGRQLPYAENLVNLVVAEKLYDVSMSEVMRVLCPRGVAYVKRGTTWTETVKPWPEDIDEWTHYLHGPDGNPVARDRVVGPPRHYQWISEPLWLRSHESDSSVRSLVTARGRLFYIADEAPISLLGDHSLPDKWFLTARDAFNGSLLWKIPIKDWGWHAWKPSWFTPRPGDIPLNIQKRLVVAGDRVYVTLGYRAPVSELDAQTGKVLKTYDGTDRTAEILYRSGLLVLTIMQEDRAKVMVVDTKSGNQLWISEDSYGGTKTDYYRFRAMHGSVTPAKVDPTLNTATDGKVVALLDSPDVVALDFKTGKEKWRTQFPLVQADYKAGGIKAQQTLWRGTLIVQDGVVIHASPNQLAAFSTDTGEIIWKQSKKYLQHLWFEWMDVFVIDGLVWTWSAELDRGKLEGGGNSSPWPISVNGYDLHTGQLRKKVPLGNIFKTHHHHRCYRNKATLRYILASRRGTEYVDLEQGRHTVHNWVRGTCHLGMMPANGLQYAPPHPCVCYIDEKLNGFNALAPAIPQEQRRKSQEETGLLERGPAFGKASGTAASDEDWPAFRHDSMRTGSVKTRISLKPELLWKKRVGNRIAPPIVVDNRLFVPLVDEHYVVAMNGLDGERQWEYTAGGRIDSSPTYYRATLLFGSADGWVYCVRVGDGRLVWRFHAAPEERLIGAFGQLESAWPVHGSILVLDGIAYFAAGRSSHLDGGIYLFGVDAVSGELRYKKRLQGPSYDINNISQNYKLPMGALPDILQGDDELIYMRDMVFNTRLEEQKPPRRQTPDRVHAKGGLLDDSYFKRTPWSFGPGNSYARLIVHDENTAYFVRMFDSLRGLDPKVYFTPGKEGYLLFATEKNTGKQIWNKRIPIRINAMVVTDNLLFVAGFPDVVDPEDPLGAFEGRKGGVLSVCDKKDGKILWESVLPAPPVFNGLVAANGRLYIAMEDGMIVAFGRL
jgi:outer membrane protein assembly factor BamB/ubiquinone/menaquinone biosynthesis C-methylase UbiE